LTSSAIRHHASARRDAGGTLRGANEADWQYPLQTAKALGWEKNLRVVK